MVKFEGKFDANLQVAANKNAFKKVTIIYIVLGLIFVLYGILMLEESLEVGIFCITFGIFFIPLGFIVRNLSTKKAIKSTPLFSDKTVMKFGFDEEKFYVSHIIENEYRSAIESKYSYLHKVIKTKTEYIIYISNASVHVVPIKDLVEGTLEELDYYFKLHLKERFFSK